MSKALPVFVLIIGIIMIIVGLAGLIVPGQILTDSSSRKPDTYPAVNGDGKDYSYIEQYVGGDAYNYIIGANLVGARITGIITARAILVVGGILVSCLGLIGIHFVNVMSEASESLVLNLRRITSRKTEDNSNRPATTYRSTASTVNQTETSHESWVCPNCGKNNPPTTSICLCGTERKK